MIELKEIVRTTQWGDGRCLTRLREIIDAVIRYFEEPGSRGYVYFDSVLYACNVDLDHAAEAARYIHAGMGQYPSTLYPLRVRVTEVIPAEARARLLRAVPTRMRAPLAYTEPAMAVLGLLDGTVFQHDTPDEAIVAACGGAVPLDELKAAGGVATRCVNALIPWVVSERVAGAARGRAHREQDSLVGRLPPPTGADADHAAALAARALRPPGAAGTDGAGSSRNLRRVPIEELDEEDMRGAASLATGGAGAGAGAAEGRGAGAGLTIYQDLGMSTYRGMEMIAESLDLSGKRVSQVTGPNALLAGKGVSMQGGSVRLVGTPSFQPLVAKLSEDADKAVLSTLWGEEISLRTNVTETRVRERVLPGVATEMLRPSHLDELMTVYEALAAAVPKDPHRAEIAARREPLARRLLGNFRKLFVRICEQRRDNQHQVYYEALYSYDLARVSLFLNLVWTSGVRPETSGTQHAARTAEQLWGEGQPLDDVDTLMTLLGQFSLPPGGNMSSVANVALMPCPERGEDGGLPGFAKLLGEARQQMLALSTSWPRGEGKGGGRKGGADKAASGASDKAPAQAGAKPAATAKSN